MKRVNSNTTIPANYKAKKKNKYSQTKSFRLNLCSDINFSLFSKGLFTIRIIPSVKFLVAYLLQVMCTNTSKWAFETRVGWWRRNLVLTCTPNVRFSRT